MDNKEKSIPCHKIQPSDSFGVMQIRIWLASQAMIGILSGKDLILSEDEEVHRQTAKASLNYADALIQEFNEGVK